MSEKELKNDETSSVDGDKREISCISQPLDWPLPEAQ